MLKREKYYNRMGQIDFHDGNITKYEKNDNKIILEFEDDYNQNITTRLTFIDAEGENDQGVVDGKIYTCRYEKYENGYYYTEFDIRGKVVVIKAKEIEVEEFTTSKLYERYKSFIFQGQSYKGKILKNDQAIEIMRLVGLYLVKKFYYDHDDCIIRFQKFMGIEGYNLRFKNGIVENYINGEKATEKEVKKYIKETGKNGFLTRKIQYWVEIGGWRFRVEDTLDNKIEVGVILAGDVEMVITCDDIIVEKI